MSAIVLREEVSADVATDLASLDSDQWAVFIDDSGIPTLMDSAGNFYTFGGVGAIVTIPFIIDGGGATITTGVKGDLHIPFDCTILEWTLLADQSGSIVVDIWKDTYANYPPVVGDSITASAKPTISSAAKGQSSTLTGWTTAIAAGDTLRFNVDSVTTHQRVLVSLKCRRTT